MMISVFARLLNDPEKLAREAIGLAGLCAAILGAQDDLKSFSKKLLIQRIISGTDVAGNQIVGFGDGYVEIELTKAVGGYAVAVATNEEKRDTSVNQWKRERLISAGADCVIPDFTDTNRLMAYIFGRQS